ncbi:MAG: phytase [Sphingomonas sp.]
MCGCTTATRPAPIAPAPTVEVAAAAETIAVATANADAADDPAIWARADAAPVDFAGRQLPGILLGTDKKAGLYVFALSGESLQFLPEGLLNNVDLRGEGAGFVAGASDRGRMGVALYRFDGTGEVRPAGFLKSDVVEPYGFCMGRVGGALVAVLIAKDGEVREYTLDTGAAAITGTERRRYAVGSQSEGCLRRRRHRHALHRRGAEGRVALSARRARGYADAGRGRGRRPAGRRCRGRDADPRRRRDPSDRLEPGQRLRGMGRERRGGRRALSRPLPRHRVGRGGRSERHRRRRRVERRDRALWPGGWWRCRTTSTKPRRRTSSWWDGPR